ncbi:MAG: hypothetical protein LCH30_09600 [Proteobacteria bacterium]|nr:hypothetical protein [Pseudomonadota bacterium]
MKGVDKPLFIFNACSELIDEDNNHFLYFVKRNDSRLIVIATIWEPSQ